MKAMYVCVYQGDMDEVSRGNLAGSQQVATERTDGKGQETRI